jgi:hypothetical protein
MFGLVQYVSHRWRTFIWRMKKLTVCNKIKYSVQEVYAELSPPFMPHIFPSLHQQEWSSNPLNKRVGPIDGLYY